MKIYCTFVAFGLLVACGHGSSPASDGPTTRTSTSSETRGDDTPRASAAGPVEVRIRVVGAPLASLSIDGGAPRVGGDGTFSLTPGAHSVTVAESRCNEAHESSITVPRESGGEVRVRPTLRTVALSVRAQRWDRAPLTEPLEVLADGDLLPVSAAGQVALPLCSSALEVRTTSLGGLYERLTLDGAAALERTVVLAPGPSMVALPRASAFFAGGLGFPGIPVHEVVIPALQVDRSEVTVTQFRECVTSGACDFDAGPPLHPGPSSADCNWGREGRDQHPIDCILWEQANAFCRHAGKRLPTRDEWEYAARSTGTHRAPDGAGYHHHYYWPWEGEALPTCEQANLRTCGRGGSVPVCSLAPGDTEQGLCDMVGNAVEMTSECADNHDYEPSDYAPGDHIPTRFCSVRGPGWIEEIRPPLLHALLREVGSMEPGVSRAPAVGFRCVRGEP